MWKDNVEVGHLCWQLAAGNRMAPIQWCSQYSHQEEWITPPFTHYRYIRGTFTGSVQVWVMDIKFPVYVDIKNRIYLVYDSQNGALFGGSTKTKKFDGKDWKDIETAHRMREREQNGRGNFFDKHQPWELSDERKRRDSARKAGFQGC